MKAPPSQGARSLGRRSEEARVDAPMSSVSFPNAQSASLPRHTLVWPATAARNALLAEATDADACASLARWLDADWPLVVRRPDPPATPSPSRVHLGLPLPPDAG